MLNFPAPENHGALHLVSRLEEALGLADSDVVIVGVDLVSHLHFFDFGLVRLLLGFLGFLFLLEFELAVVHDPAHRRIGFFADQHQIQFALFGHLQRVFPADHSELAAV